MNTSHNGRRLLVGTIMAALVAALAAGSPNVAAADEACAVSDVDYAIAGNLMVKETQFGAANGVYPLGAGKMRVRFEDGADGTPAHVKLMSYELDNHLTIKASFALWWTKVETRSRTLAASTRDGAARGDVKGGEVVWSTPVAGYHSDGSIECGGNVCGKYGAPPPGESALHEAAPDFVFKPFHFGPDGKTFTMDFSKVSHSESPKQTNFVALSGREMKRVCVSNVPASS
jgi:hypothetical protein